MNIIQQLPLLAGEQAAWSKSWKPWPGCLADLQEIRPWQIYKAPLHNKAGDGASAADSVAGGRSYSGLSTEILAPGLWNGTGDGTLSE